MSKSRRETPIDGITTVRTKSDMILDALKRQLAIIRFRQIRNKVRPLANARGYITDEDVFRDIS